MNTSVDSNSQDDEAPSETHKESKQLLKSSSIFGLMTLLSRILGLVRDIIIASVFETSKADAFFVAFRIPSFMRRLFAEGAFSVAFVPVLSEYHTRRSKAEVKLLVDQVAGSLGAVLLALSTFGIIAAPLITYLFAPGFRDDVEKFQLTAEMLRITFPYLFLISMTAFAGGILNTYGRFAVPAFTPVLLNICIISAALWLAPVLDTPLMGLAWGVAIGGVVQLAFQIPFLSRLGLIPVPKLGFKSEGVQRIMRLMMPALFGVSVSQINSLLDTLLASFLQDGSVSWLYYSDRLNELPLGIFGIAIASVILPSLSRKSASEETTNFAKTLDWGARMVLLVGVPASLALVALAEPLLITLFYRGEMTQFDIEMMSASLRAYGSGLIAYMLIKVFAAGYYSRLDSKTPVKVGVISMIANMVLNLMLVFWLDHVGLALATTLSAFLNMVLLLIGLRKAHVYKPQPGWRLFAIRMVVANVALLGFILGLSPVAEQWFAWSEWMRISSVAGVVLGGVLVYFGVLLALGMRLRHFKQH